MNPANTERDATLYCMLADSLYYLSQLLLHTTYMCNCAYVETIAHHLEHHRSQVHRLEQRLHMYYQEF